MPFLGLKNGSAEQELCPFFGDLVAPGAMVPSYGGFVGIGTRVFWGRKPIYITLF